MPSATLARPHDPEEALKRDLGALQQVEDGILGPPEQAEDHFVDSDQPAPQVACMIAAMGQGGTGRGPGVQVVDVLPGHARPEALGEVLVDLVSRHRPESQVQARA
jgi:hypothetical protein